MKNREKVRLCANVLVEVWDTETGEKLQEQRVSNLVVTAGLNLIRTRLLGTSAAAVSHVAVGSGTTAVAANQTALITERFRDSITATVTTTDGVLVVKFYLSSVNANGYTLTEAAIFNASSAGTMLARVKLASGIVKTSSIAVTFTWTVTFSAL